MVVAVAGGAATFDLLLGHAGQSYVPVVVAGTCLLALIALRGLYGQWLRTQRAQGRFLRGLVMIGANEDASAVRTMLDSEPELGYEVRGVIGESRDRPEWANLPNGHAIEQFPEIARRTDSSGVLLVANALSAAEVHRVIDLAAANGLHVQVWPGFRGLGTRRVRRLPMSGETFFYVEPERRATWQFAAKRAVDLLGAAVGLLISIPILLVAWVAIRLQNDGPALYRQARVGRDNRHFVVYKLRTMAPSIAGEAEVAIVNERTDGPLFKATHDPRVTRVGAVLAGDEHRRDSPALQCPWRDDEPGGPSTCPPRRGRTVRPRSAASACSQARNYRPLAARGSGQSLLSRLSPAGSVLRGQLVHWARSLHPRRNGPDGDHPRHEPLSPGTESSRGTSGGRVAATTLFDPSHAFVSGGHE